MCLAYTSRTLCYTSPYSPHLTPFSYTLWLIHFTLAQQVQQLGRTHRSNQAQPPKYLIISTNISGEERFASAVAKRLEQLGALTHGDRHASSAADALSSSNLQSKCVP